MAAIIKFSQDKCVWVRLNKAESEFWAKWLNWRRQNSRWLPSSSWVRMNKLESEWISLSQWSEWSESVFEWIREKITKVSESKMAVAESNMAEFKLAAIIKMSQNAWVKFFCAKWLNPRWQNSWWLPSSSWVRMNECSFILCKWWEQILASVSEFDKKKTKMAES